MLFEALLGAASDVLILRHVGEPPLVEINPDHAALPAALTPVDAGQAIAAPDVRGVDAPGSPRMHWVAGLARSGQAGAMIEMIAGHSPASETQMIVGARNHALGSTIVAMLISTLGVWWVLRHGLPDTTVRLTATEDDTGATIAVENDGAAIPPEQLERLFDRFYRADAARGRPAASSGLGLAIVMRHVGQRPPALRSLTPRHLKRHTTSL